MRNSFVFIGRGSQIRTGALFVPACHAFFCQGEWIRTTDLYVPNVAFYQLNYTLAMAGRPNEARYQLRYTPNFILFVF